MRFLIAVCLAACGSAPAPAPLAPTSAPRQAPPAAAAEPPPTITEIEARVILTEAFRAAGYRILYDVPVPLGSATVAIDGFDPEKKVGFEYRAAAETAAWTGDLPAGIDARILVIDAADRDTVEQKAAAFLATANSASDR